jgi:hypothetical protein
MKRKGRNLQAIYWRSWPMPWKFTSDYLMNGTSDDLANSSLTDKELLNQFKMIEKMTEEKKSVVKIFLDAFITKDKIKQLAL